MISFWHSKRSLAVSASALLLLLSHALLGCAADEVRDLDVDREASAPLVPVRHLERYLEYRSLFESIYAGQGNVAPGLLEKAQVAKEELLEAGVLIRRKYVFHADRRDAIEEAMKQAIVLDGVIAARMNAIIEKSPDDDEKIILDVTLLPASHEKIAGRISPDG